MLTITHADSCNCRNDGACDITLYYLPGSRLPEGVKHGTYYWGNTIRVEVRDPDGSDCTDQDRPGICVIFVDSGVGPSYYKALRALLGGSLYNMLIPEWKEDGKGVPYPIVAATSFGPNMSKEGGAGLRRRRIPLHHGPRVAQAHLGNAGSHEGLALLTPTLQQAHQCAHRRVGALTY